MYGLTFCGGDNQLFDKITKKINSEVVTASEVVIYYDD